MEELNVPGIVGIVKQNIGGKMLIEGEYYIRRKTLEKISIKGKLFVFNRGMECVGFFIGDRVFINGDDAVNLTYNESRTSLEKIADEHEFEDFNNSIASITFIGYVEKVNFFGNVMAFRFRVTKKKATDSERIDKSILVINIYPGGELIGSYRRNCLSLAQHMDGKERKISLRKVFKRLTCNNIVVVEETKDITDVLNFVKRNC